MELSIFRTILRLSISDEESQRIPRSVYNVHMYVDIRTRCRVRAHEETTGPLCEQRKIDR